MKLAGSLAATALCAAPLALLAPVAMAQDAAEEIIVTGRYGTVPDSVKTLSQSVSYADLDLATDAGKQELRHRVKLTARFLCDKLGENPASSPVVDSCRDDATKDAIARVGTLEANFAPRGTAWVQPPAWQPPYPADWTETYP